jgi:hypothetical protein
MDTDIISESKTNEIIQTVAQLEYSTLVKVLKAKNVFFKSEKQLAAFVRKRLHKSIGANYIEYSMTEKGSRNRTFLFRMNKNIVTDGDDIKLNLNIEFNEHN